MNSHLLDPFWKLFNALPADVQDEARKAYELFKIDPFDPRLQFEEKGGRKGLWSARIGKDWRVLGRRRGNDVYWFWIGPHQEYDKLLKRLR